MNNRIKYNLKIVYFLWVIVCFSSKIIAGEYPKSITLTGSLFAEYCSNVCHPPAAAVFELHDVSGKLIFKGQTKFEENGSYVIPGLITGETYFFEITDTSFLKISFKVIIPYTDKYTELSKDFLITPKKTGAELLFEVSPFKYKTSKLKEGINSFNDRVIELLKENSGINFEISCFPENDDNEGYNRTLTWERCHALKEYLMSKGIQGSRFIEKPNSKTDPMFPPPESKGPKGRRYTGSTYLIIQ